MELERLHVLQDKPFPEAKKVIMVNELGTGQFPFTAVIQGIKSLHAEDLRSIKLFLLIEAIRKFVDADATRYNCGSCHKEGSIVMIDAGGSQFALACTCSNGDIVVSLQGLARWNGKGVQQSNGRILFRSHEDRITATNESVEKEAKPEESAAHVDQYVADLVASMGGTVVDPGVQQ